MRIWTRTQDWSACVAPENNNFKCLFIIKRDKRMRDAGCCAGRACVCVPTTSIPILESGEAHAPYCNHDCQCCHATRRKLKLETAYDTQREISRMRANPACVSKSAWHYISYISCELELCHHHRPIHVPTARAQAFFMDYTHGRRAITHHASLVRIGGC
jgi:hypothetical protein